MEWLTGLPLSEITGTGVMVVVAWLVITRRLVWHSDLEDARQEAADRIKSLEDKVDKLQGLLYVALGVATKLTDATELTNEVLTKLDQAASARSGET